ncbi:hypothetical protein FNV43_RR00594 [Rhamnella rubrinervis]|uniref:Ubiquitin-like protease family profile domain-containing protein n=1 Tax=Rhamnella rubrinervis TaxID=2594499 RepID=A0A8K0HNW6_9ROSA|nr:hypothetical protein FNV43_RR00594 [Rhamnella rubrinervis]
MAPFKRLTKASEKQASSKQSASTLKPITRKIKEKENPKGLKRVAESPSPPSVEKRRRRIVEEQAPTKTTTTSASMQVRPAILPLCKAIPKGLSYNSPAKWQVVKRLIPVDKKYHAHLTSNSNITFALDVIKNKLSKGMDKLKDSFIGKFLELKTVRYCGGFTHLLLLNQVECDDTNVMEFDFHGIGVKFDRKSFAMITGLNCGKFFNEKELEHLPYDLWVKYFGDIRPMSQSDFIKAFEDLDFDESDEEVENDIWGFETILVIITLAPCGKYHGVICPRILGWSCPSTLQYTKLAPEVFDRNDHRPSDQKYYGLPVFRDDTSKSQPTMLPSLIKTVINEGTQTASHQPSDQISDLKLQITELRSDLVAMWIELRFELRQQRNEIQNISSLVHQLIDQFAPKALVVAVWDPYTPVDDEQKAALTAFLDDQSTQFHVVEYDMMDKSSFNLIMTSGGWLRDQKSPNEEEDKLTKDADSENEMRDSPFDMYTLGMLPVGSKFWLEIDYVYVPVNNDNKHWLAAKIDIQSRHITLYDSDITMSGDKFQCKNVKCLSVLFPYFLMLHGYYEHHSDLKSEENYNLQLFSIKYEDDPNLPQQIVLHMDLQDGRDDRPLCRSAFYISSLLRLVRKNLQDGRMEGKTGYPAGPSSSNLPIRPSYSAGPSSFNLPIRTCRMAGKTGHPAGPYSLIFTFKISEEGPTGWLVLPAILQDLSHPIFPS